MGWTSDLPIRRKLTLIVLIPSFVALVLASALFMAYDIVSFRQFMVDSRTGDAELIGANCTAALSFDDARTAEEILATLSIHEPVRSAFIFRPDGELFARYVRPNQSGVAISADLRPVGAVFEDNHLFVTEPIRLGDETIGMIAIQSDLSELRERTRRYVFTMVPIIFVSFVVVFSLQVRLRRPITQPLTHLTESARYVSEEQDYSARAQKEANDELGLLVDSFNDMLAQIEARDEALRNSEARLRNVLDNTQDLFYEFDLKTGAFVYISPAATEITGFEPAELMQLSILEVIESVHPEDIDATQYANLMNTKPVGAERTGRYEYRLKTKSGDYVWIFESRTIVVDENGYATSVVGALRDVTTQKEAQDEIANMRRDLQNIIDSMPSALIRVDEDGRITHWNKEAARLAGREFPEVVGKKFGDVIDMLREFADDIQRAIVDNAPLHNHQFSMRDEKGNQTNYDITVFALLDGGMEGAVIRIDDVTTRTQIEEMMVQTEKMMSVGGLAAGMAHEINNPLGGILQASQNISRRMSPDLKKNQTVAEELGIDIEKVHEYAEARGINEFIANIRSDGARAAKIVADMLAFSRRSDSVSEKANAREMIETVLRLAANDYNLKKQYDFRQVTIKQEFEDDTLEVPCDKTKIEQVLLNLVKNAAQAMSTNEAQQDPTITIKCARDGDYAQIDVIDNGPGMDAETRRRVLEPFFTTKPVGVGTGLGLSVSYFIICKQHGGQMNVESEVGKGTRFTIRLPLEAAA